VLESWVLRLSGGIFLVLLALLFALTSTPPRRRSEFLSYDDDGGTISISTEAIANYVAKLAEEFNSVVRMRPHIIAGRHAVDILVDVKIKAGPDIHEVCRLLQKRIRDAVTVGLGIAAVGKVEVSVAEILSERRSAE